MVQTGVSQSKCSLNLFQLPERKIRVKLTFLTSLQFLKQPIFLYHFVTVALCDCGIRQRITEYLSRDIKAYVSRVFISWMSLKREYAQQISLCAQRHTIQWHTV